MTKRLSFMDSILTKESEELKPHAYRAKILRGNDIVLKEDYNGKPVEKFYCSSYGQAIALAEKLNMQAPLPEPFEEGEKCCRVCSVTGEGMNEGWLTENTDEYFKYEVDALEWCKKNGYKTVKEAYEEEVIYWTEWQEDYQYIMKDGKWVDIEESKAIPRKFQAHDTPWDFVEEYYPNYSSSDEICEANDLNLILERKNSIMDEEGTELHSRYMEEFDGQICAVMNRHDQLMKEIYEEAIQNFINIQNK